MDSNDKDKPVVRKPRRGCIGIGWWGETAIVLFLVILVAAVGMPDVFKVSSEAKEAEVKSNLHHIQLSIERYAVDSGGTYPAYLIGGSGQHSVLAKDSPNTFVNVQDCPDRKSLADPLLRAGYIDAYPKNPFAMNGSVIHRFQEDYGDPLRNGTEEAKLHGTRFGPYCTLMGNVLADFRYTEFTVFGDDGAQSVFPTYADVEYPFFDLWPEGAKKPRPFLPGEFFYKSVGEITVTNGTGSQDLSSEPVIPPLTEYYMLGGYGSVHTKGKDAIGPEPKITLRLDNNTSLEVPAWTRSTMEQDERGYLGSPYGPSHLISGSDQVSYGSFNGIPDGIILILVPGIECKCSLSRSIHEY